MPSRSFPLIQTLPVPKGTEAFETKRQAILAEFISKVPEEFYIPQHYVDNPPQDVTHIPRECGILTAQELEITESYDATSLAAAIAAKKYTSVAVATAFLKRAIIADQISCCLTQWLWDSAITRAKELDDHLAKTGHTVGPLHGVPVSIKQHIPMAGTFSDVGFVSTIVHDEHDSLMVAILRDLGAVFHVKTTQPQALMHLETDCHFGRTLNPYNIHLSSGGSTGGESALIALRGSVMGVGTDIGGSVRGPAGKCGIYGFKPTSYTLPMKDFVNGGFPAELNIVCSTGPLTNSLRDMDLFMKLILRARPYLKDPRVIPIPWTGLETKLEGNEPLKIGIMLNDGVIQPQPPVLKALAWAQNQLRNHTSIQLKPFHTYRTAEAMRQIRLMYWPEGGQLVKAAAEKTGEPLHMLTKYIIQDAEGSQKNGAEISKMRVERDAFRCAFAEDWARQDVDVVLCPVYVGPAPAHDTSLYWNYTAYWNYVDCPGVVFPTPIRAGVKGSEVYPEDDTTAWNEQDAYVRKLWEEKNYEGAPINLQFVARRYHDNALFGAMGVIKGALGLQ